MSLGLAAHALRVRRHGDADRHREEERDHDGRLRDQPAARRGGAARARDLRGRDRALPADHDDDARGDDGHVADRARHRHGRRVAPAARTLRRGRACCSRSYSRSTSRPRFTSISTVSRARFMRGLQRAVRQSSPVGPVARAHACARRREASVARAPAGLGGPDATPPRSGAAGRCAGTASATSSRPGTSASPRRSRPTGTMIDVVALLPVRGRRDLVLGRELDRVEQAQHLVEVAARCSSGRSASL